MPTEYYFGIAIGIIVLVLLGLLLKPGQRRRRVVQHQTIATDQTAIQLSRIADSLEKLVLHLGASVPAEKSIVEEHSAEILSIEKQNIEKPNLEEPILEKASIEKPRVQESSVPLPNAVEPSDVDQTKIDQPTERRVKLSMFGR